jgi:hypothetical protein
MSRVSGQPVGTTQSAGPVKFSGPAYSSRDVVVQEKRLSQQEGSIAWGMGSYRM